MPHTAFSGTDAKYRGFLRSEKWSLCLGAGICRGILPNWEELTLNVLNSCANSDLTKEEFAALKKDTGWSLDAWLQTGMNLLIKREKFDPFSKYYSILEHSLYGQLLEQAERANQKVALISALNDPKKLRHRNATGLLNFFESQFGRSSLMIIARWLNQLKYPFTPHSVLTFNADGLLDTLSRLLDLAEYASKKNPNTPPDRFFRSLRASDPSRPRSTSEGWRIPIFHLHGCLVPQMPEHAEKPQREARENLIFPETTYGRISSRVFTWQQTIFLSHAQDHRIVFIGLSMSDQNIRRWLAWCNENAAEEHKLRRARSTGRGMGNNAKSTSNGYFVGQNLWITDRPKSDRLADAMEFSLAHLGTRICWLESWNDLQKTLENLAFCDANQVL